ncbi:HpcH/HpaI aldolase/citrate lyase family protein [Kutzneria buriramensis]|uniref:2-dehydro-3-deoxyglucarate aldolase/4-hydroxy-2-oxoheptanedioate aldolase n=1 Tax=Kutzneria buriramensis TaxID=1045776 RepID=A0A3E0HIM7_9PSEU|nr:aldolase/citrate lyase family protein [Kutzneria buriramensis]REH46291.1 2-dehydro-3-deoxyglucarate aldolase/4-hydroxy-2-oxoheptanedioate aldolase [Kutzneria buriramensis]
MSALRRRLLAGDAVFGTFLGLGSALAAEVCALAGFDWLLVDLEHGGGDASAFLPQQLAAQAHGVPVLVRVESGERIRAGRALDLGAAGVMVPRLDSAAEARQAVRHMWYPPSGDRGVATYNRACGFGLRPEMLDAEPGLCVIQVESRDAIAQIEEIAAVDGIDVLFVGPRDLSHDLGVPGDTSAPVFRNALKRVLATGIPAGILAPDAVTARRYADEGFRFVGVGSDASLLATSGRRAVQALGVNNRAHSEPVSFPKS